MRKAVKFEDYLIYFISPRSLIMIDKSKLGIIITRFHLAFSMGKNEHEN